MIWPINKRVRESVTLKLESPNPKGEPPNFAKLLSINVEPFAKYLATTIFANLSIT